MATGEPTKDLTTIKDLLKHESWEACLAAIEATFAEGGLLKSHEAFLYYSRSRCLSQLDRYDAVLEAGQLAVYLAQEVKDYDLLGSALLELAWAQHKTVGMESQAVETQRKFFTYFPMYQDREMRTRYLIHQKNLGVYLRAAGRYPEAFEQFKFTCNEAKKHKNKSMAQLMRSAAAWEALRLRRMDDAERLIAEEEGANCDDPETEIARLVDKAQLAVLKDKMLDACDFALQAMPYLEKTKVETDLLPVLFEILHRVAEFNGDIRLATRLACLAKTKAEELNRQDILGQVSASIRRLALMYPGEADEVFKTMDGVTND